MIQSFSHILDLCLRLFFFNFFLRFDGFIIELIDIYKIGSHISLILASEIQLKLILVHFYILPLIVVLNCKEQQTANNTVIKYDRLGANLLFNPHLFV